MLGVSLSDLTPIPHCCHLTDPEASGPVRDPNKRLPDYICSLPVSDHAHYTWYTALIAHTLVAIYTEDMLEINLSSALNIMSFIFYF